jgi:DNA-binding protein YbaB
MSGFKGMFDAMGGLGNMKNMMEQIRTQRITGTAAAGNVRFTVSGFGQCERVEFRQATENLSREELADLVTEAAQDAFKQLPWSEMLKNTSEETDFMSKLK